MNVISRRVLHVKYKMHFMAYSLDLQDDSEGSYATIIRIDRNFNYLDWKEGVIP